MRKKWNANPNNIADILIDIIESLIDNSLPYLVYTINIVKEKNPITRKTHARTQMVIEGT
ncbi:MAG: hypothetical protein KGD70_00190 [Candidatus Lokiarchaeota archaeon]|jgi:hypothetical protein|nr:hypothetical protein [Candidatus Lokiarchaeota archaeon]